MSYLWYQLLRMQNREDWVVGAVEENSRPKYLFSAIFFGKIKLEIIVEYIVYLLSFNLILLLFGLFLLLFGLLFIVIWDFYFLFKGLMIMFGGLRFFLLNLNFWDSQIKLFIKFF